MQSEMQINLLIAAAARQGVRLTTVEAEILIITLERDGYSLIIEADWTIKVHQQRYRDMHDNDWSMDARELVEIAVDINKEAILDMSSEIDADPEALIDLQKNQYILDITLEKAKAVIPAKLQKYDIGIIVNYKIYDRIEAASWSEAEATVYQNWAAGKYKVTDRDFKGIIVTNV